MTNRAYQTRLLGALLLVLASVFSTPAYSADQTRLGEARKVEDQAFDLFKSNKFSEALPLLEKAFRLYTEILGERHPDTLGSLNNLAVTYRNLGRDAEAMGLLEKALRLKTEVLGERHPDTLTSLNNLAATYASLGRHAEALPLDTKALRLRAEVLGERDPHTLTSLNNLAETYRNLGRHAEALPLHERALKLRTEVLGERHPHTLGSLNNLAVTYRNLGRDVEALPLVEKLLRLRTETFGERHPLTVTSINNLAVTYGNLGRYAEALALQDKVLRLSTEVLGERHPDTLTSLSNLAETYRNFGRHAEALPLHERALRLSTEVLGERHPGTLTSLNNLALTYNNLGRYTEALPLHEKALRLYTEVLGERHTDTLRSLANLAATHEDLGRRAKALALSEKALRLYTEVLGERHPDTLRALSNLAATYASLGRHAEALPLDTKALRLRTEVLGERHPDTLGSLNNLAVRYTYLGREAEATPLFDRLVRGVEALRISGDLSSENRQALFAKWITSYKNYAHLLLWQNRNTDAFRIAELSKARTLLESTALRRANESGVLSPAEQEKVRFFERRLSVLNDRLAAAFNQPDEKLKLETEKNQIIRDYAEYRRALAAKHPKYAEFSDVKIVTENDGRRLLPPDAVFISYLLPKHGPPIVFLLDEQNGLRTKALEKTADLDRTIEAYRKLLSNPQGNTGLAEEGLTVAQLPNRTFVVMPVKGRKPDTQPVKDASEIGRALAEKLLKPLLPEIAGKRHWIISPDGALSMLPFEALLLEDGPVIAKHDVSYVQSLSMLALLKKREDDLKKLKDRRTLLAMGGALYQAGGKPAEGRGHRTVKRRGGTTQIDISQAVARSQNDPKGIERAFDLLGLEWLNLPGTETEINNVSKLFGKGGATVYLREQATEAKLLELNRSKELAKYKYLLFSAHGYLSTEEPALSAVVLGQMNKAPGTDGYVTASEWPAYDLKSDLIVLSACDTGVGKVVQGEGVMGLPYALYVAGNKNTVLSLWPVVDESTAEFMTSFFGKLKAGVPQVKALNDTKREFLNGKKFDKPVFWAPFIMYGI
jgi:CHAT domain-containing protein/tetratricopeptide (TPR) repeat protein